MFSTDVPPVMPCAASVEIKEEAFKQYVISSATLLCDSFPEPCQAVNVQSNDPCGEDSVLHWQSKSCPPAILPLG